ncbi:tight adherence protein B [Streptomyces sp. DvalAA-14]|uniref:type II secretion system F family protein n=1 Tax=unclassified Streptomyces TaxID=2593676 RepID=UPI00081BAA56|nr:MULTISPECIES: type II secretion system F family protein [unclassified Streptomyces]SCD78846.1 tight adherence protein B [Streptomyces sp. DvalAA-14]
MALGWAAALCAAVLILRTARPAVAVRRRAFRLVGGAEHRIARSTGERAREAATRLRRAAVGRPWVPCLALGLLLGLMTRSLLPVVGSAAGAPLTGRALSRRAERAAAERGLAAVGTLCGRVAGDLRAGRPPHAALADAVESAGWARMPELAQSAGLMLSAARFGGDVPGALRAASRLHEGTRGLAAVAACWQVAVDGGAGLAAALDRVAAVLRAEADQREDLRAQLAGPRSTAVLLALLPLFGLVLGTGLGAHPTATLLHSPAGLVCLLAGAALEWAGLAWTARIIRAAEDGHRGGPPKERGQQTEADPVVMAGPAREAAS